MHRFVKILLLSATVMLLFLMCTACLETEDEVKAEHSLVYREAVAADCVSEGNTEYWYCTDCGKYFSDEAATTEISLNDTVIAKSAHKTVLNSEISATCSNDGQRAYYKCTVCNEKFNDENGENKITDESSLVLPATDIHISVHHNAVPSTCKELGTKEYWSCSTCDGIKNVQTAISPIKIQTCSHYEKIFIFMTEIRHALTVIFRCRQKEKNYT